MGGKDTGGEAEGTEKERRRKEEVKGKERGREGENNVLKERLSTDAEVH